MTIVRPLTYVPNAWANRVSSVGVSDSPTTPRTPEMLILRVGIGRMEYGVRRLAAALVIRDYAKFKSGAKSPHSKVSLVQSVTGPIQQAACFRRVLGLNNNPNYGFRVGSSHVYPAFR